MNFLEKVKLYPTHLRGELMSDPYRNGEYKFLKKLMSNFTEDSTIFDVGANVGNYSEKIMELNGKPKVHCFEPTPDTFKVLSSKFDEHPNFKLNHLALSNEKGQRIIYEYGKLNGTNSLELHPDLVSERTNKFEISTDTLDNYCITHGIDQVDYLKIDVEGHEVNVLAGAKSMLDQRKIGAIQLEYNHLWKNTDNRMKDVFEILIENYNIYRLTFWGKIHVKQFTPSVESFPSAANYVAIVK